MAQSGIELSGLRTEGHKVVQSGIELSGLRTEGH